MPPQIPNFSPLSRAYSRQSSRATQPRQTSFASLVEAPRSGKKRSGSTPMQFALDCQPRSSMPLKISTNVMLYSLPALTYVNGVITTVSLLRGLEEKANANIKIPDKWGLRRGANWRDDGEQNRPTRSCP